MWGVVLVSLGSKQPSIGAGAAPPAARNLSSTDAPWRIARFALLACAYFVALLLVARGLYYVWLATAYVRWPYESTFGEGTLLAEASLLEQGPLSGLRAIYGPRLPDRFIAGNYPPLYLLLWALKAGPAAFPTGRALSILAGLATAAASASLVYCAAPGGAVTRVAGALLGGGTLLCTLPMLQQLGVAKPDMVALALVAWGLFAFEVFPGRRGIVVAGSLFALAILTKQSAGFGLIAAAVAAFMRRPRDVVTLLGAVLVTLALSLGGLFALAGPALYDHLVLSNIRIWHADRAWQFTARFITLHWPLLLVALAHGAWAVWARRGSALAYYPFVALAVLPTAGSEGGGRLYFLELCLALAVAVGLAVGSLLARTRRSTLPLSLAALALVALFTRTAYVEFTLGKYVPAPRLADGGRLYPQLLRLDRTPDPVLSEEPGLVAMRRRTVIIDDSFLADLMRRRGLWDNQGIVDAVIAERYNAIFVRTTDEAILRARWGDAFVDALLAHYREGGDATYLPRSR